MLAGDGGTYDIGFQCLSSAAERNENILYVCLDNEGYMNTGAQKSSSTPHLARTGSTPAGKTTRKKNLTEIMAAHEIPYAATATVGFLPDLVRKVEKAKAIHGMRLITLLVPCLDGWGVPDDAGLAAARCAVECGVFPLYEVEDGRRYTLNGRRRRGRSPITWRCSDAIGTYAGGHRRAAGRGRRRLGAARDQGRSGTESKPGSRVIADIGDGRRPTLRHARLGFPPQSHAINDKRARADVASGGPVAKRLLSVLTCLPAPA